MGKYKLTVDFPSRPKDDPIEVSPFGVVPNGSSVEVEMDEDYAKVINDTFGLSASKASSGGRSSRKDEPQNEEGGED